MTEDVHQRAIRMISAEQVEGLTDSERGWLGDHLSVCPDCSRKADALGRALFSLRSVSVEMSPGLVAATRRRVRNRAAEIAEQRSRLSVVSMAIALSLVWMVLSGLLFWSGFEWLGRSQGWVDPVWQSTFLLGWFLPATAVSLALALIRAQVLRGVQN